MNSNHLVNDYLNKLAQAGYVSYREFPESNRWLISIKLVGSAEVEEFVVEIFLMDDWISFTSLVLTNLEGENISSFYEFLFRMSSYLNGFKFGITPDGEFITIQTELNNRNLNIDSFFDTLKWFSTFYIQWYPVILDSAYKLHLKFRKAQNRTVDDLMGELIGVGFNNISQINGQ